MLKGCPVLLYRENPGANAWHLRLDYPQTVTEVFLLRHKPEVRDGGVCAGSRIPFEGAVPTWELLLSIGLLLVTFLAIVYLSGKIYRIGILMYGKKASWKDLWKWIKY